MRPRPLPALVVVAASASLLGAGRLWFSALKSDRVVTSPPALYAPPLRAPAAPQPPLVVHAAPVAPVSKRGKTPTKHPRSHSTPRLKATPRGVGGVSIIVDIGSAAEHTQTQQPAAPPKPIVIPPLPTQPGGHPKPKPVQPPKPKPKPVTPPAPVQPAPAPTPTPAPPVTTPTAPPAANPPVATQTAAPSTPPVVTPTPPTPPIPPTPPAGGTPSAAVVNGPQPSEPDTRPGNGWGDKNHEHTGPPGQDK